MKQSALLTAFYMAVLRYIKTGENLHEFTRFKPLCSLLHSFASNREQWNQLYNEMRQQFEDAGLSRVHPFNAAYGELLQYHDHYQNPKRVAWVVDHARMDLVDGINSAS